MHTHTQSYSGWQQRGSDYWFYDFTKLSDPSGLHSRALPGYWQTATYKTKGFGGTMIISNPSQNAPEIRIPLPVKGRWAITIGVIQNYCDRLLLKLDRDRCFLKLTHSACLPGSMSLEECWWRDVDLAEGDVLVLKQDTDMKRRCAIAFIRLHSALALTKPELPILICADGLPGNHGPVSLDQMLVEELMFADTHVSDILHGTDINGAAQYITKLPDHRYPVEKIAEEKYPDDEYYLWTVRQYQKYQDEGRCPLRDSIDAAHSIGRRIFAYYRMAITRLYPPFKSIFHCPFFDAHPEWRSVDFDGTPICRLSIAFPEVRQYFLEHFRETVELGADGVCLVFTKGWPLLLFEKPVADEFKQQTGKDIRSVKPDDPDLLRVRTDILTQFVRDIRRTVTEAGGGRKVEIVALVLATTAINRHYAMDCEAWCSEGLVETLVPFPFGMTAVPTPIGDIKEWLSVVKGTQTRLCPTLNRMTYEPAGVFETPKSMLDRAEQWLAAGVHGFTFWDMDWYLAVPSFRQFGFQLASKEGRQRLRQFIERGPILYPLEDMDGLAVDRYPPGWNI